MSSAQAPSSASTTKHTKFRPYVPETPPRSPTPPSAGSTRVKPGSQITVQLEWRRPMSSTDKVRGAVILGEPGQRRLMQQEAARKMVRRLTDYKAVEIIGRAFQVSRCLRDCPCAAGFAFRAPETLLCILQDPPSALGATRSAQRLLGTAWYCPSTLYADGEAPDRRQSIGSQSESHGSPFETLEPCTVPLKPRLSLEHEVHVCLEGGGEMCPRSGRGTAWSPPYVTPSPHPIRFASLPSGNLSADNQSQAMWSTHSTSVTMWRIGHETEPLAHSTTPETDVRCSVEGLTASLPLCSKLQAVPDLCVLYHPLWSDPVIHVLIGGPAGLVLEESCAQSKTHSSGRRQPRKHQEVPLPEDGSNHNDASSEKPHEPTADSAGGSPSSYINAKPSLFRHLSKGWYAKEGDYESGRKFMAMWQEMRAEQDTDDPEAQEGDKGSFATT
ncbi:hypothetical protein DB88DRAFT_546040 [Papiliotrema laurentii]|uniref:Uncharacterized protein n=1 Tax=Papiliotrema laurentii TaxID=5418 RepID=A0AAD9FQN3_PAPLA|nr:hypothetical protein DB88DRAFT_546040 [Papiliotrema laurentii]